MRLGFKIGVVITLALLITILAVSPIFVISSPPKLKTASSSGPIQLTSGYATNLDPSFSPDGRTIAYTSNENSNSFHIWLMKSDGSHQFQLTSLSGDQRYPQWSPDGRKVAFLSMTQNSSEIWVVNVQTRTLKQVSQNTNTNKTTFEWNPSGTLIAYDAMQDDGNLEIFLTSTETWKTVQLTQVSQGDNLYPSWSTDGNWILFSSNRSGLYKIYQMNPSGADLKQLSFGKGDDLRPVMGPGGFNIAYTSDATGDRVMCLMNRNGSVMYPVQSIPLRQKPGIDFSPQVQSESYPIWRPDGKALLYNAIYPDLLIFYLNVTVVNYNGVGRGSSQLGNALSILSTGPIVQMEPAWRPDSGAIVLVSNQIGSMNLYLLVFKSSAPNPYG